LVGKKITYLKSTIENEKTKSCLAIGRNQPISWKTN